MASDIEMADVEMKHISETPHSTINASNTADSGYLSLTPQTRDSRMRASSAKRRDHYRTRTSGLRSKFNRLINSSDKCDSVIDESQEVSHDSGNFSCDSSFGTSLTSEVKERRRNLRSWRSTLGPITPASRLQLLSPPPSPALPCSSCAASEPIDADVEMKLVIASQSTPFDGNFGGNLGKEFTCLHYSPTGRRTSPRKIIIDKNDNFESARVSVNDRGVLGECKPKRLNFSQRAYATHRTRATPDLTGKKTVDPLTLLGEKTNHWSVVRKILSYLSPHDLCSISMVSKAWRRILINDPLANMRRLGNVIVRQNTKENLKVIKSKAKTIGTFPVKFGTPMSPGRKFPRKGYLASVQNLLDVPKNQVIPRSPPVSPSKIKFHSFVKVREFFFF